MSTKKDPAKKPEKTTAKKPEKVPAKKPEKNAAERGAGLSETVCEVLKDRKPIDAVVICTACAEFEKRCVVAMMDTFAKEVAETFSSVGRIVDRDDADNMKLTIRMLADGANKVAETVYKTLKGVEITCTATKTDDGSNVIAKKTFRPSHPDGKPSVAKKR